MSVCMGGMNSNSAREVQFNLMNSSAYSQRQKRKQFQFKQNSNSKALEPLENNTEIISKKEEVKESQNNIDKEKELNNIIRLENIVNNNLNNNINNKNSNNIIFKKKLSGNSNCYIKMKKIESSEDFCDIIECEDEFECEKNISNTGKIKNSEILSDKRVDYLPIKNKEINDKENINQNDVKQENGGNMLDNRENQLLIKDYDDKGKPNLKLSNNINLFRISKPTNLSFSDKNEESKKKIVENDSTKIDSENFKNSNKKNKDFNNCKIDNNISFNINNSMVITNNNNNLNNNMNNFNNISGINSDFNNNNYIDISSNMTYFLSLEKSLHKPQSTRFVKKNILSLSQNPNPNNNTSYNKELEDNNFRNSVKVNNKYKWKLLPKHKYNTQIYKSIMNIPNIPSPQENQHESQSLLISEDEQKNLNLTNLTPINSKSDNSMVLSEIQKQKEKQDKLIKTLENKIKNLEKKIHDGNKSKANEKKTHKISLINNQEAENQKDFRIKKLEEQLNTVKKNNKLNKSLIKKKDEQIKNLIEKKNKQDELIKKYEINKNTKPKTINYNFTSKHQSKEISNYEELSKSYNYNNYITSNSNSNLLESKLSFTNMNNTLNVRQKRTKRKESINNKKRKYHKKEKSVSIQKHLLKNNSASLDDCTSLEPENDLFKINSSIRESIKNNLNKSAANISYHKYCNDLSNKEKKNYSNKITLNKMKIYKLNKSKSLSINCENKLNIFQKPTKKAKRKSKSIKEELNLDFNYKNLNNNSNSTTKKNKKKFSFTKSKKFAKKQSEKDLKEMYLQAGTVQNEETSTINHNHTNSDFKLVTYNDLLLLTHKNSFTNSGGETSATNKINNGINVSLEENFNLIENVININNVNNINPIMKSISNEQIDKSETVKIQQNLWKEGYLRYKKLIQGKKIKEGKNTINNDSLKINFVIANDLIELKVDKKDLMIEIKNKFLKEYAKKKTFGEYEKNFIRDNIQFLKKDGIIDMNKKALENNLSNNDVIIPILKEKT